MSKNVPTTEELLRRQIQSGKDRIRFLTGKIARLEALPHTWLGCDAKEWHDAFTSKFDACQQKNLELIAARRDTQLYLQRAEEAERQLAQIRTTLGFAPSPLQPRNFRCTGHHLDRKIEAIKAIREVTGLGLKEAKQLSEGVTWLDATNHWGDPAPIPSPEVLTRLVSATRPYGCNWENV